MSADTVTPVSWSLLVQAGIGGAHDSLAAFGVRADALPDYDPQYDIPRPPAPPGVSIQVYFPHEGGDWPTMLGNKFATDYTSPQSPSWRMVVETNGGPGIVTLRWDTAAVGALPASYYLLMTDSAADSLVRLRETGSYAFSYDGPRVFLLAAEFASTIVGTTAGWNIVSVPRFVADSTASTLFPGAVSPAFGFDSAYHVRDSMSTGRGYWLKFGSPAVVAVTGLSVDALEVPVRGGWNMIGALSQTIAAPVGTEIVSFFYEYAAGYNRADSLLPGKGYWVKVSGDGLLPLGPAAAENPAGKSDRGADGFPSITLSTPGGARTTLLLLPADAGADPRHFELPPLPPAPAFDARFTDGCGAALLPGGSGAEYTIALQTDEPLVDVIGEAGSSALILTAETGPERWSAITGRSEPVALTRDPGRPYIRLRAVPADGRPAGFRIDGNFPNPFNPVTHIRFDLPAPSDVTLSVTDALGRLVYRSSAVANTSGPGEFLFDAGPQGLVSGVYFFRIDGEPSGSGRRFTGSGKMLFLK